jgi:hypothetical protein
LTQALDQDVQGSVATEKCAIILKVRQDYRITRKEFVNGLELQVTLTKVKRALQRKLFSARIHANGAPKRIHISEQTTSGLLFCSNLCVKKRRIDGDMAD